MTVDRDVWTCPQPGCGETVRGTAVHRRAQQRDHARRHANERKAATCRACGKPFAPIHDADAPGPTVRHPFLPVVLGRRPDGGLAIPAAPRAVRRTR